MYAAPAWSGACTADERAKLYSLINRCRRLGYCSENEPSFSELANDADDRLFSRIMNNANHVLQPLLPNRHDISYNLRRRAIQNKSLITKTVNLNNKHFIIRTIYKNSYLIYTGK